MVVVLSPDPPKEEVWAEVSEMTNILYMKGNALDIDCLRHAGVDRARAVVVLSSAGAGMYFIIIIKMIKMMMIDY